jgi:hypothetical protein
MDKGRSIHADILTSALARVVFDCALAQANPTLAKADVVQSQFVDLKELVWMQV